MRTVRGPSNDQGVARLDGVAHRRACCEVHAIYLATMGKSWTAGTGLVHNEREDTPVTTVVAARQVDVSQVAATQADVAVKTSRRSLPRPMRGAFAGAADFDADRAGQSAFQAGQSAVTALGHKNDAKASADASAGSAAEAAATLVKDVPGGVPTLDGNARVPDVRLPERLSSDALSVTIDARSGADFFSQSRAGGTPSAIAPLATLDVLNTALSPWLAANYSTGDFFTVAVPTPIIGVTLPIGYGPVGNIEVAVFTSTTDTTPALPQNALRTYRKVATTGVSTRQR